MDSGRLLEYSPARRLELGTVKWEGYRVRRPAKGLLSFVVGWIYKCSSRGVDGGFYPAYTVQFPLYLVVEGPARRAGPQLRALRQDEGVELTAPISA